MSTTPAPLTAAQLAVIQQKCNLASAKTFPGQFMQISSALKPPASEAIFLFTAEPDGSTILANGNISVAERETRCEALLKAGYAPIMLFDLCKMGEDHFQVYKQYRDGGMAYYPPWCIETKTGLVPQPKPGQPGQYALPNDFHPGMGLLGEWPTTKPDGWIDIPDVNQLLVPGADVDAVLKELFK